MVCFGPRKSSRQTFAGQGQQLGPQTNARGTNQYAGPPTPPTSWMNSPQSQHAVTEILRRREEAQRRSAPVPVTGYSRPPTRNVPPPTVIICCNLQCRSKLFAPPGGGQFRCPACHTSQRLPPQLEEKLKHDHGIICNAPSCSCTFYEATHERKDDSDNIPCCRCCQHKQSMHNVAPSEIVKTINLPLYWTGELSEIKRYPVSPKVLAGIQKLMNETWKNVATKDREGDKTVKNFEVVSVHRNQNAVCWNRYAMKREIIRREMDPIMKGQLLPKTHQFLDYMDGEYCVDPLQLDVNEMYLFHGTKPSSAQAIANTEFKTSFTGSNKGTLLGQGVYFAESSSKSDEYAKGDDGIYGDLLATLLVRVTMGNYLYDAEQYPDPEALTKQVTNGPYHSVMGDREAIRDTFREFVVFNGNQAYTEFIVIYKRVDRREKEPWE